MEGELRDSRTSSMSSLGAPRFFTPMGPPGAGPSGSQAGGSGNLYQQLYQQQQKQQRQHGQAFSGGGAPPTSAGTNYSVGGSVGDGAGHASRTGSAGGAGPTSPGAQRPVDRNHVGLDPHAAVHQYHQPNDTVSARSSHESHPHGFAQGAQYASYQHREAADHHTARQDHPAAANATAYHSSTHTLPEGHRQPFSTSSSVASQPAAYSQGQVHWSHEGAVGASAEHGYPHSHHSVSSHHSHGEPAHAWHGQQQEGVYPHDNAGPAVQHSGHEAVEWHGYGHAMDSNHTASASSQQAVDPLSQHLYGISNAVQEHASAAHHHGEVPHYYTAPHDDPEDGPQADDGAGFFDDGGPAPGAHGKQPGLEQGHSTQAAYALANGSHDPGSGTGHYSARHSTDQHLQHGGDQHNHYGRAESEHSAGAGDHGHGPEVQTAGDGFGTTVLVDALADLQSQAGEYKTWVSQYSNVTISAVDPGSKTASMVTSPEAIPSLVRSMHAAAQARSHLAAVQAAAEAAREAERAAAAFATCSLPPTGSGDDAGSARGTNPGNGGIPEHSEDDPAMAAAALTAEGTYQNAAYAAIVALSGAYAQLEYVATYDAAYTPEARKAFPQLQSLESALLARLGRVAASLEQRLRADATSQLSALGWPPALVPYSSGGAVPHSPLGPGGPPAPWGPASPDPKSAGALARQRSIPEGGDERSAQAAAAEMEWDADPEFENFRKSLSVRGSRSSSRSGMRPQSAWPAGGFEEAIALRPGTARRLSTVLTSLTSLQVGVTQRKDFVELLANSQDSREAQGGEDDESRSSVDGGGGAKHPQRPLLWACEVLTEPLARRLLLHFDPSTPAGRLDRPDWLFSVALSLMRDHAGGLAAMDPVLSCIGLKPHYNFPAEFCRCLQKAVLDALVNLRIPTMMRLLDGEALGEDAAMDASAAGDTPPTAEQRRTAAEALWLQLADAAAVYDLQLLPLLGAGGAAAEAVAAKAAAAAAAGAGRMRTLGGQRPSEALDPSAAHLDPDAASRLVAMAALGSKPEVLAAWMSAELSGTIRSSEAIVFDDSSLLPAEQALAAALGGDLDDMGSPDAAASRQPAWRQEEWPPVMTQQLAALLDAVAARSRWLAADPGAQQAFLEQVGGGMLSLLVRRLQRLMDQAGTFNAILAEDWLPKVCAALCAAQHMQSHVTALMHTVLASLARIHETQWHARMEEEAAAPGEHTPAARSTAANSEVGSSMLPLKTPDGKLGGGGASGLRAAAGGFAAQLAVKLGGWAVGSVGSNLGSPGRVALRDGVSLAASRSQLLNAAAPSGLGSVNERHPSGPPPAVWAVQVSELGSLHRDGCLRLARELALGFGKGSVAYRHAIEVNPTFPFTAEDAGDAGEAAGERVTPSLAPALVFLQGALARLSGLLDKFSFGDVWRATALSLNRFMFNFIATESRFTRAGAQQFAVDVRALAAVFAPYTAKRTATGGAAQHLRELLAAAKLLCISDEEAADVVRRASAAAVAASQDGGSRFSTPARRPGADASTRWTPVRSGMAADPVLSAAGLTCLSPAQILNVIEHRV